MSNQLALNNYMHDPVKVIGGKAIQNFVDEITDYDAGANSKFQHSSFQVPPQSGLSNVFVNSTQQIDFLVNSGQVLSHYDKIQLQCRIQNTGAAVATLLASHFLIDHIEVQFGGSTIEDIYPHHLMFNELYLANSDEEVLNNRFYRNFGGGVGGTVYQNPATLAAGATRDFFIEIPCVLSKTKCFMDAIKQTITFRIHFGSTALASSSLATTIALTECNLLVDGRQYDDIIKQKLIARYKQMDHIFGYYEPNRSIVPGQTVSNTVRTTVQNTVFGGYHSALLAVMLVAQNASREQLYAFTGLSHLELQRNGQTINSFSNIPADYWKAQMAPKFYTTAVFTESLYVIPQSNLPVESLNFGLQRGVDKLTNNDVFLIQTSAGAPAVYDVYVLCYRFTNFIVRRDGTATLVRCN